jgi:uncharacterized protein YciI
MFVILLRFSANESQAAQFMEGHKRWLQRGFDAGVFLLAGTLQPKLGGAIVAQGPSLPELRARLEDDPFVAEGIVSAEVLEIAVSRADERLEFLLS